MERRKDSNGRVLKENETQRKDGTYMYRWRSSIGKRETIYAPTLDKLREKEDNIQRDKYDGIRTDAKNVTLNEVFDLWKIMKKGLKDNTFQNYMYTWERFVRDDIGKNRIVALKKSDIRRYYNKMLDERGLKVATIDSIHTVLHQVLDVAVEDGYIRNNIGDKAIKELKQSRNLGSEKRMALTVEQQDLFLEYLRVTPMYNHWYPVFAFMLGTGLRVGELTGLRFEDVDEEEGLIDVNHTLVYYRHSDNGCYFGINTPKTKKGERTIPMMKSVKEALEQEKEYQEYTGIHCKVSIDGYTNFIFVNQNGNVQNQSTLNKALKRIIRDCNQKVLDNRKGNEKVILLPNFSCHNLRHTFATRLCEAGVNIKVIQELLGHTDISTTLDIYTDATKDFKKKEMLNFEEFMNKKDNE
ncbi:site-specific integrase [Butyrivibrio sp. WCD3002]|uniref:site-specific integrase n=1 Tax=Butyrivibrio sp. WCD3002 TaxID=1280676 RepID=UPI0004279673|nr:site-specific integrase [Butyrivibrio sp. WCD3002]